MPKHRTEEVAIFSGMSVHMATIQEMLLVEDSFQLAASTQLLSLYCTHKGRSVSAQLLKFLLGSCAKEQQFAVVVQLVGQLEQFHTNIVVKPCRMDSETKRWTLMCFSLIWPNCRSSSLAAATLGESCDKLPGTAGGASCQT